MGNDDLASLAKLFVNRADELVCADVREGDQLLRGLAREDENIESQARHRERVGLLRRLDPEGVRSAGLERESVGNKEVGV